MTPDTDSINRLTETIIGCSFRVLNTLGTGFLEKVYQNALAYELHKHGLTCRRSARFPSIVRGCWSGSSRVTWSLNDRSSWN